MGTFAPSDGMDADAESSADRCPPGDEPGGGRSKASRTLGFRSRRTGRGFGETGTSVPGDEKLTLDEGSTTVPGAARLSNAASDRKVAARAHAYLLSGQLLDREAR
ncbi:hypothetical protein [Nocardia nova]|uniref:hypothetical protein n=1 Tax=Nocardia nova TaxID=37330 RepID=UPI0033E68267